MEFNNLNDLLKYAQKQVNNALQDEVAETVKETISNEVTEVVYNVYEPSIYNRRFGSGGLADNNNMVDELVSDGVLEVSNNTPLNNSYGANPYGKTLAEIVVSGEGYMYNNGGAYTQPRDFIEATRENLKQSGRHIDALKIGLKKRGIDIK